MWTKRKVAATDCAIERTSAKDLTAAEFQRKYVEQNTPVIITDLNLWNHKQCDGNLDGINACLEDEHTLNNVFVTTNNHRFLYFDQPDEAKNDKELQTRQKMTWKEFRSRIRPTNHKKTQVPLPPILGEEEKYYLYGEKLPQALQKHINVPSFLPLSHDTNGGHNDTDSDENDDCLIWISAHRTCSPLHFDFCEGFLCQLDGMKRVCLFKFDAHKLDSFYAYPFHSQHKRQSMIDDIHKPDLETFALFANDKEMIGYQGEIRQNEGLYIPFSWWHQIESDEKLGSISLSFRWNPYLTDIKTAILTSSRVKSPLISEIIFNECIQNTPVYIQNIAPIWKQIFDSNKDDNQDINESNQDEEAPESTQPTAEIWLHTIFFEREQTHGPPSSARSSFASSMSTDLLHWYECEGLAGFTQWRIFHIEAIICGSLSICSCIFIICSAIKYRHVLSDADVSFTAQIPICLCICDLGYGIFHGGDHVYSLMKGYVMHGPICTIFGAMKALSINTQTAWAIGCAVYMYRNLVFNGEYRAKHNLYYHVCCWGFPLLIFVFGLAFNIYGLEHCWCGTKHTLVNFWITDLWIFIALFLLVTVYGSIVWRLRLVIKMTQRFHTDEPPSSPKTQGMKKAALMTALYPIAYFVQWFSYSLTKMNALPQAFSVWIFNVLFTNSGGVYTLLFYGPLLFNQIKRFKQEQITRMTFTE